MKTDPFEHNLRLKRPCKNCPFLKKGAIELKPGRLDDIVAGLIENDLSTFTCHKTTNHSHEGEWDETGEYRASGQEAMCAGAATYLMKKRSPTVSMRFAFATGVADPSDWDNVKDLIID